ncbi:hypothetical protein [Caballeronia zhejiangensis]|uniref:hypothetical protein n=1 Tax=Caballeronia zhejiangensis TaxID=871203 RepID=UPI00158A7E36|nr:hypothetical protein [Caballeronia zhejiangensis]
MADITVPKTTAVDNPFTPEAAPSTDAPIAPRAAPAVDTSAAVDGYLKNTAQGAQANLAIAFGANPDYEAELARLSKQTGVPIDSARKFPDQVKQQAYLGSVDFDRLSKQFPSTAAFYQNQGNANVAHDDIDALQNVERSTTALGPPGNTVPLAPGTTGYFQPDNSPLPFRTRITDWARNLLGMGPGEGNAQGAAGAQAFIQQYAKDNNVPVGAMRDAVGGMSEVPTQFAQGFFNSFLAGLAPDVNGEAQTTAGGVASGAGQLAGFVAGAPLKLAGAAVERLPGLTHVAGESFAKALARDVGTQATTLGIASAITATGQALDQSTPSAALATLGMAGLHGAEMGGVFGAAGRVLPDNTVVQTIARAVGVNALMDAIQGTNPLDNRPTAQKIFDYGLNTMFSLHGAGRATGGWLRDAARAETATADGAGLQNLADAAAQSKLRARDPDTFRDFVAQANENGPVQNVYVDGNTFANALAQSGFKMADIERTMPDVAKQIPEALATGGDVTIPVADFAAHIAGSKAQDALMPHLKTDPEGMTLQEANEFHQSAVDQFQKTAEQAVADKGNDDAVSQSAQVVHDDIMRQLGEANRFTPDVNKVYAALVRDTYTAAAARAGTTPEAIYQRYPLRIAAEDVTGANSVDQAARGKLSFADDISSAPSTITLNKSADLSTFTHELGHFNLEMLAHMSRNGALPDVAADFKTVTDWFGTTPEQWREMTLDQKRNYHEQFARGFEAYLFEGKAPSAELRGVFQKVRAWMVNVYRSLRALNVELSPEVRGVFDRLLATNDAIRNAEAERAYAPMFATPEEAGMTPEQFADYHKLGHEATLEASDELSARTLRDMRFADNSKIRALREIQKDVAAKRRETRAEVEAQVASEPIYRAENFIRRGELDDTKQTNRQRKILDSAAGGSTKLSLEALKEMYGEGEAAPWRYLDTGKNGLAAKEGMHPDVMAELFGFSSGDELVRKLLEAEKQKDVVDAVTDQRMLEKYGDITDPAAMNRAANEAIHNEVRTRFIATELKALAKATGPVRELERAAREVAQNTIANKKVREISAAKYAAAEARAAKLADAALRKGDLAEAAAQKRNQLLNNQLEKAARNAATEVTKGIGYLRKFDTPSKTIDPDYRGQIEALLDRFDLRSSTTGKDIARRESLVKWVEARTEEGLTPVIPEELLNEAYRKSYKDMTIDEMRGLIDSVRNIEHLGRLKQKLLTLADKREFNAFIEEAVGTIETNAKQTLPEKIESNQLADKIKAKANRFLADHRTLSSLLQQMDGKDGGFLWDKIVRPMNERGDWEAKRRSEATKALREIFEPIVKQGDLRTKTYIPEIDTSLSKEGRLAVALNWGNETNQRRVLTGDKWTPAQANAILKTLSKEDWQFVQKVWDHIDTYWPEIAEKQYRVTGVRPEKVEAQSFINPHGDTMRGGYYPIKYDPVRSTRAEEHEETATLKQMLGGAVTRATTRRGFTESRVEDVNRPVRKDLGVVTQHVEEVLHDLAWHEWLIDTNRVLGSGRFGDAVRAHYGPEVLSTMKETAKSIALGDVASKHAMDVALAFLRKGTIVSRLGFNVISALKQFGGFGPTAALIGPSYMRRGLIEYMGSAFQRQRVTESVYAKSDFMRLRGQTMNRDIREIRNQIDAGAHPLIETISQVLPAAQRTAPAVEAVKDSYLWMIEYTQRHVDVPSWLGAYRKGLNDFAGDEAKAVSYADQVVRDSQGSGLIADQPQIMRGGQLAKLFTTFYSALNAQYNLLAKAKGQGGVARLASAYMIAIALPSLYTAAVANLRGHQGGDDDWQMRMTGDYFQELLGNTLGMGVGVRELSSILQGFDYTGPTPLTPIADLGQFVKQAKQGEIDEGALRAANKVAGDILHYPAGLLDRVAEGYLAWQNGDASAAAMIVGKPSK